MLLSTLIKVKVHMSARGKRYVPVIRKLQNLARTCLLIPLCTPHCPNFKFLNFLSIFLKYFTDFRRLRPSSMTSIDNSVSQFFSVLKFLVSLTTEASNIWQVVSFLLLFHKYRNICTADFCNLNNLIYILQKSSTRIKYK